MYLVLTALGARVMGRDTRGRDWVPFPGKRVGHSLASLSLE